MTKAQDEAREKALKDAAALAEKQAAEQKEAQDQDESKADDAKDDEPKPQTPAKDGTLYVESHQNLAGLDLSWGEKKRVPDSAELRQALVIGAVTLVED